MPKIVLNVENWNPKRRAAKVKFCWMLKTETRREGKAKIKKTFFRMLKIETRKKGSQILFYFLFIYLFIYLFIEIRKERQPNILLRAENWNPKVREANTCWMLKIETRREGQPTIVECWKLKPEGKVSQQLLSVENWNPKGRSANNCWMLKIETRREGKPKMLLNVDNWKPKGRAAKNFVEC